MADRLSLRLVRPSKMDEPQSEKLSGATGQLRTPRPIYSPAPFVLQDAGGYCTLREGESLPSPLSPSQVRTYLHAIAWWRVMALGSIDTIIWNGGRNYPKTQTSNARYTYIVWETQRSDFLGASEMRVSDFYYQDYGGIEANEKTWHGIIWSVLKRIIWIMICNYNITSASTQII